MNAMHRLVVAMLFALTPSLAHADLRFDKCVVETNLTPEHIQAMGRKYYPGVSLRICSLEGKPAGYFVLSRPWKGRQGVCHYESQELYSKTDASGRMTLSDSASPDQNAVYQTAYMLASEEPCPLPSDQRYVATNQTTEGLFLLISDLWRRVSSNKDGLNAVCNVIPAGKRVEQTYKQMESDLHSGDGHLDSIGLRDWQAEYMPPNQYELRIGGLMKDPSGWYVISVDFVGNQLCITWVGAGIA